MTDALRRASLTREVRRMLWEQWDPIGVRGLGGPVDEYDGYAVRIWSMLSSDQAAEDIARYLQSTATDHIGLSSSPELQAKCETVAYKLLALNVSKPPPAEYPVLARTEGAVGRLTLNRPKALHALTTEMCRLMTEGLLAWRDDPAVALVMIDHAGERGFCAGGDIRILAESGAGDGAAAREFFAAEYRLNALLHDYPKPTLAIMDGVTMGGGVGISRPCRFRVATERTVFAMPETGIGLFPDVGGGWFLPRMPGAIGMWLALTGARLKAADCLLTAVATDYVESVRVEALKAAVLADPAAVETILTEHGADAGPPPLAQVQDDIDRLFAAGTLVGIMDALGADDGEWARAQGHVLSTKSPSSMAVAFRQLREGARMPDFAAEMAQEFRIGARVVHSADFLEGVRALIVDKDNAPHWNPSTVEAVTPAMLDAVFAPLPPGEAWTPLA